jgi:uridine kinase
MASLEHMPENYKNHLKPTVILVSGYMGCGKTTFVETFAEMLGNAPTLIFDHYEKFTQWPEDIGDWMLDGADSTQIKVPRLKDDLRSLCLGTSITHPLDGRIIHPSEIILVEEPFGTERGEITEFIDLVVFIDVPRDVCVVRLMQRSLGTNEADFDGRIKRETREELGKRVKSAAFWLNHYMWIRPGLKLTETIQRKADIIVDGMKPVGEMAQEVLAEIKSRDLYPK